MTDQQDITQGELPPCPFCGKTVDLSDADVLYPSGIYWREEDGIRHYVSAKERTETDTPCWVFNCPVTSGGCGASIDGDSKEEVVEKWNTRAVNEENKRLHEHLLYIESYLEEAIYARTHGNLLELEPLLDDVRKFLGKPEL